jgi:ABC-type polysaccharide/polyol phosphate export permease
LSSPASIQLRLALLDLWEGLRLIHVWPMLGWLEIKQRYRRSVIGPFWLTLSTAALVGGMGPLYSKLLGQPMSDYFSYIAVSFVLWMFIMALVNDGCSAFINAESFIKQIKLPLTVHVLRVVWKNLIILAHNAVVVVVVLFFFGKGFDHHVLLVPLGLFVIAVNGVWIGILLGLVCARFRDVPQIVASLMQVAMFLTPVFWPADMLGRHRWAAEVNPIFHALEIVRRPLLGQSPDPLSWAVMLGVAAAGYFVTLGLFRRYRARIAYWV